MRNSLPGLMRSVTRLAAVAVTLVTGLLWGTLGMANAAAARPEPEAMTFGVLGPVGLVAVVLGVLGMAAGVLRQRKKARAAQQPEPVLAEEPALTPTRSPN
ncbi:hypothetical protein [Amycolatopsis sp. YIM 10]|uniref:hypothetical protein n=1 Tax=Amycolatopsis sp. YIM 10 TaxID=2653857 RepID=UPI0012A84F68|nr:hypothetical protein YIM_43420 [Amycolatopsis sp. YIM 10]